MRQKLVASHAALETALVGLGEDESRRREAGWSIREIIDHLAQTNIRAAEELRHLLTGRRPPLPPVYEGLLSGGAVWAPVDELVVGLQASNVELQAVLAKGGDTGDHPVTARTIVVVNERRPDGTVEAATFPIELEWRAYAMVQRLHAIDRSRYSPPAVRSSLTTAEVRSLQAADLGHRLGRRDECQHHPRPHLLNDVASTPCPGNPTAPSASPSPTLQILAAFMADLSRDDWYGRAVSVHTGLGSGTVLQCLYRLENWGWLESRREDREVATRDGRRRGGSTP